MGSTRLFFLRLALFLTGLVFIFGLYSMMHHFPDAWTWEPRQKEYEQMFLGVYATLGVFLIIATKNPLKHRSLINFTIWSSLVHATIMLVQALDDKTEQANLMGDIPGLYIIAVILFILMPRKASE